MAILVNQNGCMVTNSEKKVGNFTIYYLSVDTHDNPHDNPRAICMEKFSPNLFMWCVKRYGKFDGFLHNEKDHHCHMMPV